MCKVFRVPKVWKVLKVDTKCCVFCVFQDLKDLLIFGVSMCFEKMDCGRNDHFKMFKGVAKYEYKVG